MPEQVYPDPADSLRTTDPATMRALAHPLRVEILALLGEHDELTATEVAAALDQTVANCSFHLRTLAKHGYVERTQPRGREKPWRAAHHSHNFTPDPENVQSVAQASSLAALYARREFSRLIQTFERASVEPPDPEWALASTLTTGDFWATAEEMLDLVTTVNALLEPFVGRGQDATLRPRGSRRGHIFATVNPDPDSDPTP